MAQPVIHLLERYGVAYRHWGQVTGAEDQSVISLIAQVRLAHTEAGPEAGFESFLDSLLLAGLQVTPPSTMSRWIYTDPIKPLQSGQASNQNALIL